MFCTNESDVVWLLYQMDQSSPQITREEIKAGRADAADGQEFGNRSINPFTRHPLDIGSAGAVHTLRAVRFYGGEDAFTEGTMRYRYEAVQNMEWLHIRQGFTKRPYGQAVKQDILQKEWTDLSYVGDKMPTQVADPEVFNWWITRFPETRFIHLVRDPRRVVASMKKLGFNTWWKDDIDKVYYQWAEIEHWALDIERKIPDQVIRLRQEDLSGDPDRLMRNVVTFLGLHNAVTFAKQARPAESEPLDAPDDPYVREVMEEYGYG